jgi:TRAP-type C4-dicarboxylate transport system substrate-binding protein
MSRKSILIAAALAILAPVGAAAEPIKLKLSYFAGLETPTYLYGVKPFVDSVNIAGKGLVEIQVFTDGALGKAQAQQPQLVLDGVADIAFLVPGLTPYRFPDNVLLEQPGHFRDIREGTLAYTRLIATKALRGYQDFFVIGAYTTGPSYIHSRKPIDSIAALKGQKIRGNNPIEADSLELLGAMPTVLESTKLEETIKAGVIDGSTLSPAGLFQFGVSRVATNHYLLGIGVAPLALVMNRKKFDDLPEPAKAVIREHSGEWAAVAWIKGFGAAEKGLLEKLKSDPERKVVEPSASDLEFAQRSFRSMVDTWAAKNQRNRHLQTLIETEIATIRSGP